MISEKPTVWKVDPQLVSIAELASWCVVHHGVDRMLVIVPTSPGRGRYRSEKEAEKAQAVIDRTNLLFGGYTLDRVPVTAWPGTELMGGTASAFIVEFNQTVAATLSETEPDLSKWLHNAQPPLPEDICLFTKSGSYPIFVSNSHEGQAWLITDKVPDLKGVSRSELPVEELFFKGPYFSRAYQASPSRYK